MRRRPTSDAQEKTPGTFSAPCGLQASLKTKKPGTFVLSDARYKI